MSDGGASGAPLPAGYVMVEKLGQGGFASVWLAEQGRLGRRVAVKVLAESLDDSERERRFVAECQAIGRLSGHPAVVTVHDAGTTADGHPYLVMEHLPGGSLHDRLRRTGPLPWPEVVEVGVSVADALAAAHAASILHRDVKPANVLLDENGSPKLGDFGIARLAEGTHTATGTLVGTIPYTPPEVLSGHPPAPTADIWSLGATLHTLLTAQSPFSGDRDEPPAATIARVLRSEAPALPPSVPTELRDLIASMLAADPAHRPGSCTDVVRDLQALQQARGLPVTPARATRGSGAPPTPRPGDDPTVIGVATPAPTPTPSPPPPQPPSAPAPGAAVSAPTPTPGAPVIGPPPSPTPPGQWAAPAPDASSAPTAVDPSAATHVGGALGPRPAAPTQVGEAVPEPRPPALPPVAGPSPAAGSGSSHRRGLLLAAAAVIVLVLIAGAALVLTRGGDRETAEGAGPTTAESDPETETTEPPRRADQVDSIWGSLQTVPSGVRVAPEAVVGAERAVDCGGTLTCSAASIGDDALLAFSEDGGASTVVERISTVDGSARWRTEVPTPARNLAVATAGPLVLLASSEDGELRRYRAFDPDTGAERWDVTYADADRSIRPAVQPSDEVMLMMLNAGFEGRPGAAGIDYATGEELWREPGRVLGVDLGAVYVSLDRQIIARDLRTGEPRWQAAIEVDGDGSSPTGRLGVVADDVLITVAGGAAVALATEDGSEAWSERVPLSVPEVELGAALAVSAAGGVAIVAAASGDIGLDPRSGTVAWREQRAPLIVGGESNLWIGTADRLAAGQLGGTLWLIATADGQIVAETPLESGPSSLSSFPFEDGIAVLGDSGAQAFDLVDLTPLWTDGSSAGARTLVTVEGGVVVLSGEGIRLLRAPGG